MDEVDVLIEDIEKVYHLIDVLKSRYFFLRAKYDVECSSQSTYASKDLQKENQYASDDLQSCVMLELRLLECACTHGIYSVSMYATRLKNTLSVNETDQLYLKILKNNVQSLVVTNKKIADLPTDFYHSFHLYMNKYMVNANILNGINISNSALSDETKIERKKTKLAKKISHINIMANIISIFVSDKITDYTTDEGRAAINIALKYRTPRSLDYYSKLLDSKKN